MLAIVLCIATVAAIFLLIGETKKNGEVYEKTLRLHVLANSDTEEDQKLKLAVKDAVILHISAEMNQCKSKEEAESYIAQNKEKIEEVAYAAVVANGGNYTVNLTVTKEHYPRKTYGEVTLPAGEYSSVRIHLGEAEGQNWWCVLFPQVCTDTATPAEERLSQAGFSSAQIRLLTGEEKPEYKFKLKILELLSALIAK